MKSKSKFKLNHPDYGQWFATSIYSVAKAVGCTAANLYNNKDLSKPVNYRDWLIEPTDESLEDIPSKFINADIEFIKKYYWDFQMQLEKNIVTERDEI